MLADHLFLIALDERTGRPRLSPRVLGLGLAGALLGELVLEGKIVIEDGHVSVRDRRPPADALAHTTLDHLVAEHGRHPVRSWLPFLAQRATEQVGERLWRAGMVHRERVRRGLRRAEPVYPPADPNAAYMPTARMATALGQRLQVTWDEAALAGLLLATGLDSHVLYAAGPGARDYLQHLVEQLPTSLHELVWHVHAACGDAVLTGRT